MPHVSKNANFSEKGIENARLVTLALMWQAGKYGLLFPLWRLQKKSDHATFALQKRWPFFPRGGNEETRKGAKSWFFFFFCMIGEAWSLEAGKFEGQLRTSLNLGVWGSDGRGVR